MLQTHATIRQAAPETPVVAVITRNLTASLNSAETETVLQVMRDNGLPIAGALRQNLALAEAVLTGRRPDQLVGEQGQRISDDLFTLTLSIGNVLGTKGPN